MFIKVYFYSFIELIYGMKRVLLIMVMVITASAAFAQLSAVGTYTTVNQPADVNSIFIFNPIDDNSEIHYKSNDPNAFIRWFTYLNGIKTPMTNVSVTSSATSIDTYFKPQNNTGYIVNVDGVETSFWVFDYNQYLFSSNTIRVTDGDFPCENVNVNLQGIIPEFSYQSPIGRLLSLPRECTLSYSTLSWAGESWERKDTTINIKVPPMEFQVDVPLTNTGFTLTGDQFAAKLGLLPATVYSDEYQTKAVKCKITTITSARTELNENERPDATSLTGSAPLEIQFFSNPTPNVRSYLWQIYKDGDLILTRTEQNHQYNFTEAGNYKVKLQVSNNFCTDSAFVDISVSESQIMAPNVFTPNGDGKNDEFRVAYKSIVEFQATILNRWGRVLHQWTNPAKGWDGKINGKPAAEGTYFYIITAKGSDGKPYKLKGHINLLR